MRILLIILFFVKSFLSFSQSQEDYKMIIQLIIEKLDSKNVKVYKKFMNTSTLNLIEHYKLSQDMQMFEKYSLIKDSIGDIKYQEMIDGYWWSDTVNIELENIKINYSSNKDYLDKTNQKSISKFFNSSNYEKRKRKRPVVFLSFPILSSDNEKALIFDSHVCGPLCGVGGVYFLEKNNDKWKIIDWEVREVY